MKSENEMMKALFDGLDPTEEQIFRMERNIMEECWRAGKEKSRKWHLMPVLAAALIMAIGVSAVAAAVPAVKRYFYPGLGVVELDESVDVPFYMLVDQDCDEGTDFTCQYGVWQNNSAEVWFTSQTRYEDIASDVLFGDVNAELKFKWISNKDGDPLTQVNTYCVVYSDITWEEAAAGLPLGEHTVPFTRMAAEYRTYSVEDCGLQLELIPLTDDLTTFVAEISYLDGRGDLDLNQDAWDMYDPTPNAGYAMTLVDAEGNTYPLKRSPKINIFSIDTAPAAEIVGFRADYLAFTRDFYTEGEAVTVELPLPADGESMDVNLEFVFPDGVTKGRVRAVGYNTSLSEEPHVIDYEYISDVSDGNVIKERNPLFGMEYYAVVTDAVEQNGIQYWPRLIPIDDDYVFAASDFIEDVRTFYKFEDEWTPKSPMHLVGTKGLENGIEHIVHYVPDGRDTVTMKADRYDAIAYGCWDIDFTDSP